MIASAKPVARRLIWRLVLVSLVVSGVVSSLAVALDYMQVRERAVERLQQIETSYLDSVAENLWLQDRERLASLIVGIQALPYVDGVEVTDDTGSVVVARRHDYGGERLVHNFPLGYQHRQKWVPLGKLTITISLWEMRRPVMQRAWGVLLVSLLIVCATSAMAYALVRRLVTAPLEHMADYARSLPQNGIADLSRTPPMADSRSSELRDLSLAFRELLHAVQASYDRLQDSEARYRRIFDYSPVSLWEEDFSRVKQRIEAVRQQLGAHSDDFLHMLPRLAQECAPLVKVLDVNQATLSLHRASSREDLLGRLDKTFTSDSYAAFERQLLALWLGEYELDHEASVRTLDGDIVQVVVHWLVPEAYQDSCAKVIIALEDVTEHKRLEQALTSSVEKMAQINGELERFAFGASHDLQEPVRSIVSFSQLLDRRLSGRLQGDEADLLQYLVAAAQRMQQQVRGLHDYAAVTVLPSAFGPVDMNDVLDGALRELQPLIVERKADIRAEPLPWVHGDRSQLVNLLRHLLTNAMTFTAPEVTPTIRITAKSMDERHYCLTIQDNGIGIDADYAADVFQLFRRLHGPSRYPGAGIGLATCRRIMDRHGGSIWVAPNQLQGTRICFTLPKRSG